MGRAFNSNGQPITPTGTTNRIGRADFEAYRHRRAIEQQQKAQQNLKTQVLDVSKLPAQVAYNQIIAANKAGMLSRYELQSKLNEINQREQSKLAESMKVTPAKVYAETAHNIYGGAKDFVVGSLNTIRQQTGISAESQISKGSALLNPKLVQLRINYINREAKKGTISRAKADAEIAKLQRDVKTKQAMLSKAEEKYGAKLDPTAGLMAAVDVASMATGVPALAKALYKAGGKVGAKVLATETGQRALASETGQKVLASKPSQYLFGDKTAVQEAVAKAKAPKVAETPKVEPTVAEKPITPPKKIEVTTPQVTKTIDIGGVKLKPEMININKLKTSNGVVLDKELTDSIKENGVVPLLVDKNNMVYEGQHRLESLKVLGEKNVPIYRVDMADIDKMSENTRLAFLDKYNLSETTPVAQVTKTPVGEQRVTGGAKKLEAQTGVTAGEKATYTGTSYKANKITSEELVKNNRQEAFKAMEDAENYTPAQRQEIYKSLVKLSKKNELSDLEIMRLKNSKSLSEQAASAQILGQSGFEADSSDPFKAMKKLKDERVKSTERRTGIKVDAETKKLAKAAKSNIKVPSKDDWKNMFSSLECK